MHVSNEASAGQILEGGRGRGNGGTECLKLLLAAGGDVNKCDKDGVSPIYYPSNWTVNCSYSTPTGS
jgi:hypothetical protein